MKRYLQGIFGIVRAYQLRFYRDKTALFFTIMFPLIFLFIFGTIFGNDSEPSFNIALINQAESSFAEGFVEQAKESDTFTIQPDVRDLDAAEELLSSNEIDSIIVLPAGFGDSRDDGMPAGQMDVYYQQGSEQSGQTVAAIMEQILGEINRGMGQPEPNFTVAQVASGDQSLNRFDYTFAGLLGFTILGTTLFGLATVMPSEKQRGSFRRLLAAPFKASQLLIGNMLHYLLITIVSIIIMVLVALVVFDFQMRGSWLDFGVFAILATMMMIGVGLLIGGWAKNENQAAPLANLAAFPMMFLSGIFFPRFLFPEWLQGITSFVPLTPVVEGFRRIMTENASLLELGPQLLVIGVWAVVIYALAIRLFRWQ